MYRMIMPDGLQEEMERLIDEYDKQLEIEITLKEYVDNNCSPEMKAYQAESVKFAQAKKEQGILV